MKKTVFIFAFFTISLFLVTSSCKKDTPVTATTSYKVPEKVSFGKMKATIDGKSFDFNLITAVEIMNVVLVVYLDPYQSGAEGGERLLKIF